VTLIRTAVRISFFWAISVSLLGCAVFRSNDLPELGQMSGPAATAKKPAAGYEFSSAIDMGGKRPSHEKARVIHEREFVETLRESGYFAAVEKGSGKDVHVVVDLVDSSDPAALVGAVITGLSLYTIPSWATSTMEIACKVTTADGKTREYKLKDSAVLVQWLPMMVVFPFRPFSGLVDMRKNLYKHLIVKMQEDGLLPRSGQPAKTSRTFIRLEVPAV
jgi:hypothetical protein